MPKGQHFLTAILAILVCQGDGSGRIGSAPVTVTIDSTVTYQTWIGWAGRSITDIPDPARLQIIEDAYRNLGITATGIEARFKAGNEAPNLIGWDSLQTMTFATRWALPLQRLAGKDFRLTVRSEGEPASREEVRRVLTALRNVGLEPDIWIALNEPDVGRMKPDLPEVLDSMAVACQVFREMGVKTRLSGPTYSTVGRSAARAPAMLGDPRLDSCLGEISFHLYGGINRQNLERIGALGRQHGLPTVMDEHHGAATTELFDALEYANLSLWQRDGFAGPGCARCWSLYSSPAGKPWFLAGNTGYYRQFMTAIRPGMVRWKTTTDREGLRVVAFGGNGRAAVVFQTREPDSVRIRGLPPGTYAISYVPGDGRWNGAGSTSPEPVGLPEVQLVSGADVTVWVPDQAVVAVRKR